jgi:hypothetical protein
MPLVIVWADPLMAVRVRVKSIFCEKKLNLPLVLYSKNRRNEKKIHNNGKAIMLI